MSADDIADFYVHTITVETFQGTSGYGEDIYAAPVTLTPPDGVFVEGGRKLVRDKDGQQVVSTRTVYTRPDHADLFTPDSRITYRGATSQVIQAVVNDSSEELDLPDHLVVNLT